MVIKGNKVSLFIFLVSFLSINPELFGKIESKRILAFHFDRIEARGALSIFIQPGKRNRQIEYFADSSIIDSVSAFVRNRTLFLDANNSFSVSKRIPLLRLSAQRTFPIEVFVSVNELEELTLLENCNASLNKISGKSLKLFMSSTGTLQVNNLKVETIDVRHEGSGDIVLNSREVRSLNAEVLGSGSLRGEELFLNEAKIRHYGRGRVIVAPQDWLDAQILGQGDLHLLESPLGKVIKNSGQGGKLFEEYLD